MRSLLVFVFALASAVSQAEIRVSDAWARATVPGQQVGAAFMTLSSSKAARLLGAHCECAKTVQVHLTQEINGVASMREQKTVALPAGKSLQFQPGGLHIMLLGLKAPLLAGQQIPLVLSVEQNGKRSQLPIQVGVRPVVAAEDEHQGHHD